ncbi:glyoxalase superfamily protein [Thalassospira xianhensis]|uniref:Glyoxalase-related protein domain-containing protein n=1 Tax=Thalassospira xianhensis MCCC 1A02616 TaxID=1177929 RepID=A0A367UKW6_9PROT|nr:glyoxalase superfamily protein [Thalassospira xianhensis]RCK07772.1 hypothetical protein TH5_01635 [Thalassospira xianhensis MCCC 1A02616]
MTLLGNENACAPVVRLKKRAYSIQSRMKELGHQVSLAHAYEILATSSGFRNWPTMKAKANTCGRKFEIGHEIKVKFDGGKRTVAANLKKPIEIPLPDCVDHFEVVGPPGRTRSDVLAGIATNAINQGDCLVYLDGGGNAVSCQRLREFASKHGRASDVNVISLPSGLTGSVRYNPFATGSAEELAELLAQTSESVSDEEDTGNIWRIRANAMLASVLRPLVWLRDKGEVRLDAATIRAYLSFEKVHELRQQEGGIPTEILSQLRLYLSSLPLYDESAGTEQHHVTLTHHGYHVLFFDKVLEPLVTTYGDIFHHHSDATSLDKIIAEKRILVVQFPNLMKGSEDIGHVARLFYLDIIRAMKARATSDVSGVVTAVLDNCEAALPQHLDKTMSEAGASGACLVFGWQHSPLSPALKRSVSIHLSEVEPGRATVVTKNGRYNAAMKLAEV